MSRPNDIEYPSTSHQAKEEREKTKMEEEVEESVSEFEDFDKSELENHKKKKRVHLSADAQLICLKVIKNLIVIDNFGKEAAVQKTAALTEVSTTKIRDLFNYGVKNRKQRKDCGVHRKLTLDVEEIIREEICSFISENKTPTTEVLFKKVQQRGVQIQKKTLCVWLKKLGFKFK